MMRRSVLVAGMVVSLLAGAAFGQATAPIADPVQIPLLPSGITEQDVVLDGSLAYLFKDEDGTDAAHYLGGFELRFADQPTQTLRSKEAVVWINARRHEGRPYQHLQILLWRDAEITEVAGTSTYGSALFVTLNTFGEVRTTVDDLTFRSSASREVYQEGNIIRRAIAEAQLLPGDADSSIRVVDPTGLTAEREPKTPKPPVIFQTRGTLSRLQLDDRSVITVVGGAYLSRGDPKSGDFLEIQSDSVVVFQPPTVEDADEQSLGEAGLGAQDPTQHRSVAQRRRAAQRRPRDPANRQTITGGFGETEVEAVYLEGDVRMTQGAISIRASRLYYDFVQERAVILDAVLHTMLEKRGVPLYVRAQEIRQLSTNQFVAEGAVLTTSEFHTPHYHIGARRIELIDRTPREPSGRRGVVRAGSFKIKDATLNLEGHPLLWWPFLRGTIDTSESALRSLRVGFSDDFGAELETDWHLFNLLGLEQPEGVSATLSLDFFTERGVAIGVDAEYERDTYFGLFRSYLMTDNGEDSLGRQRRTTAEHDVRGRALLRHRLYMEDDWQLSLEFSYISDENFLEEFFESEFDNDKEQETLLYLKKQRDNWAFTATLQSRILDFTTQTERFPDFGFHLAGEPIGGGATWFSENRAGIVRFRPKDQTFLELLREGRTRGSGAVMRVDSRQEVGIPLDLGPLRVVPFGAVRGSMWDDSPRSGGLQRGFATVGVRGSMYFWKTFPDAKSTLLDIDGVRHIIKPDFVAWVSESNRDPDDLFPFDATVEGIHETDGVAIGLRQRWQTKRGSGEYRRQVDFLTLDVEMGFFNGNKDDAVTNGFASFSRPENSIARNYVNASLIWRINDRTALLSEMNYDVNDGEIDIFNLSLAVERSPRLSYLLGYRFIEESDSNLLAFDLNYRLNEKHTLAVRELFDLERGRTLDFTIAFIRKFPRWYAALSFELDDAEDDFGVSVSVWPEGLPRAALGSRRFTGLAQSTRLRND